MKTKPRRKTSKKKTAPGFGQRVAALRIAQDLSQRELGLAIKRPTGWVSDIEIGRAMPTLDALMTFSAFFSVSIDWLVWGD